MATLEASGLWKYFGNYPALRDVSLSATGGDCVALLGPNGAGKTTLLKLLARLSKPQKGSLTLPERARTGYIGHGLGLYEELSALDNLTFWAEAYGAAPTSAMQWLARVNLASVATAPVRQFSRGMRQRVALGRAFLHEPDLLILDEPFTGLDKTSTALLQELIAAALARKATVILSSHQLPEVMELATHVAQLDRGRLASMERAA